MPGLWRKSLLTRSLNSQLGLAPTVLKVAAGRCPVWSPAVRNRARAANRSRRRARKTFTSLAHILYMIAEQSPVLDEEPMGIVISCGPEGDEAPAVFEYVWGPAPEDTADALESKVA